MIPSLATPPLRRPARMLVTVVTAVALLVSGLASAFPAWAAVGVPVTYLDHTYASSSPPTADKPQSKLWFHDGAWWALMVESGGTSVYIHELLDNHSWRKTGALVDSRPNSTGDALWSKRDDTLYVASRVTGTSNLRVNSYTYSSSTRSWAVASSNDVNSGGGSESASIDQDSAGRLWVTYTRASRVWIAYSDADGANWTAGFQPPVPDTVIKSDDLSAVVAFGGNSVGVMYSDQESGGFHFAIHNDADPVEVWRSEDVLKAPGMSDDHINLKQLAGDSAGRVFAAIKTSQGDLDTDPDDAPLVGVLTRTGSTNGTGSWAFAAAGTVADDHTRPLIMINSTDQQLYFFATAPVSGGDIFYKKAPLSDINFDSQPGRGTPFVDATPVVNNASGAKDPVTTETGLVILAVAHGKKQYVHAEMAVGPGGKFDGGGSGDPAPTVTATTPLDKATGVSATTNVTATFSEDVQGVRDTTFTLKDAVGAVSATVAYDSASRTATLDPAASLAAGSTYTATLTGDSTAIRDNASQPLQTVSWSFTTTPSGDSTAPTVKSRAPAAGATSVGLSANVGATFSEAVQGVDKKTFTLKDPNGTVVPAVVSLSSTTNKWVLNPDSNLAKDTVYTATLTGGTTAIRDLAGNPLTTTSWQFLTGPRPTVSSRTPASGATGVSRTASITATFSEPVQGVIGTTFALKDSSGATVDADVSQSGTTDKWILDPRTDMLAANTMYTVTITGGLTAIRDLVGNPLKTVTWTFTTGAS
jgi:hypothetical protein